MNSSPSSVPPEHPSGDAGEEFVRRVRNLPAVPAVVKRISALARSEQASAADIEEALKLDPALVGKVIRLANSAYVGIPRTVSSLHNAVVLLGLRRIHALALGSSVLSAFRTVRSSSVVSLRNLHRHSVTTAMVAESIAKHIARYEELDHDEIFTAGLLHDIGTFALAGYAPEVLEEAVAGSRNGGIPFHAAEHHDTAHPVVGEALARHWRFPADLCEALRCHHEPGSCRTYGLMVAVVHVADAMVHVLGFHCFEDETGPRFDDGAVASVRLPAERLKVIAEQTLEREEEVDSLVDFMG